MAKKTKREEQARQRELLWVGGILAALVALGVGAVVLLVASARPPEAVTSEDAPGETVIVPFTRAEPTYTTGEYSGVVTLVISGTGQAGGQDWSDAFYLYLKGDGQPYIPPQTEMFDLEIDGDRAIHTLDLTDSPPPYSPQHIYRVRYDVGPEPRRIAFRISDSVVGDNTGQFTVGVFEAR